MWSGFSFIYRYNKWQLVKSSIELRLTKKTTEPMELGTVAKYSGLPLSRKI